MEKNSTQDLRLGVIISFRKYVYKYLNIGEEIKL